MSPQRGNRAVGRVPFTDSTARDVFEDEDGRQRVTPPRRSAAARAVSSAWCAWPPASSVRT